MVKQINIDRSLLNTQKPKAQTEGIWIKEGEVAYIRIPSFENNEYEDKAIEFINLFKEAKSIIIDLRDNEGGHNSL